MTLRVLDLFSGIGGFSLGLERTGGFETVAFCEIEEFPRRVLAKHWPEVPCYHDVTKLTADILRRDGITGIDVITGGFPCQDISTAGRQAGIGEETRSGLWSEIVRLIGELRPRYVIVENVANLLSGPSERRGGWFGRVLGDLAECGYDAEWENIPAAAVGLPHRRERVWIVAYPNESEHAVELVYPRYHGEGWASEGGCEPGREAQDGQRVWPDISRGREENVGEAWIDWAIAACGSSPLVVGASDGLRDWLDRDAALGNAVVPQIPEMIGHAILRTLPSLQQSNGNQKGVRRD